MGADGTIKIYMCDKLLEILKKYGFELDTFKDESEELSRRWDIHVYIQSFGDEYFITDYYGENNGYESLFSSINTTNNSKDKQKRIDRFNKIVEEINENAHITDWEVWT